MASLSLLHKLRRRRRERERDKSYDGLVAANHDFGSIAAGASSVANLALPAGARLAISHSVALDAEDVTVTIAGANINFTHPALVADEIYRGAWGEETMVVTIGRGAGAPAGDFILYMVSPLGLHRAIGTATFS